MTVIEKAYEEWKKSKKTIRIGDYTYYRIVWSECFRFSFKDKKIISAVLSPDMPKGKYYEDENGNHFKFAGYHFIRFTGEIPEWYFRAGECSLEWQETKEVGKYLRVIE